MFKKHAPRAIRHINTYKKHYALWLFWTYAIVKTILLFAGLFSVANIYNNTFAAGTTLSAGDIVMVTANATDPDLFEFIPRVDLDAGTVIYFTDNARSGDNTRRSTEWTVRYTAPNIISAGTAISFVAWYETTYPATWEMSWSFLLSTAGDTILAYQWTTYNAPTPNFIYGIWWGIATSRISSGSPTANNSYVPSSLTLWTTILAYSPWTHKNIQYGCSNLGMQSSSFLSTISNVTSRSWNASIRYSPISCTFDATKPQFSIDLADGQNDPTSWSVIKFLVTFSEAIHTWDFTCSDVDVNGTAAGKTCVSITEIAPNNWTTFEVTTSVTGNWVILINMEPDRITDLAGNPNDWATIVDNGVVVNITPPYLSEITSIPTPSSNTTPSYTFHSNEWWTITYSWSCSSSTTSAIPWNNTITLNTLPEWIYNDCTIIVTDNLWSVSDPLSISTFTIDTTIPYIIETTPVTTPTNNTTPNYTFTTDESWLQILYGGDCTSTTTNTISWVNTITFDTLVEWTHNNCIINIIDWVGNTWTLNVSSFTIDTTAPIISEIAPVSTPTEDTTPDYIFTTDEAWTIIYWWSCSSSTSTVIIGNNTITLNTLNAWTYNDCTIAIRDWASNISNVLPLSLFVITTPSWNNWWWSIVLHQDYCPDWDFSSSYYDGICDIKNNEQTTESETNTNIESEEPLWHWSANIQNNERTINRKTLAKFLVFFAKDVLHLEADTQKSCIFSDIQNETSASQLIIQQACQLELMWLQQNGSTLLEKFRPMAIVTRNELITTLSRLLFDGENNIILSSSLDFYVNHTLALQNIDILKYIPERITQSTIITILKYIYENQNIVERK